MLACKGRESRASGPTLSDIHAASCVVKLPASCYRRRMGKNLNKPLGHRVSDEAHARLKRLAESRGTTSTQVIEDALLALEEGKAVTKAQVLDYLRRNLKGK